MTSRPSSAWSPRLGESRPGTGSPRPALHPPLLSDDPPLLLAAACTLQSSPPARLRSAGTRPSSPAAPVAAEQGEQGRYANLKKKQQKKHFAFAEEGGNTLKLSSNEQNYSSASILFCLGSLSKNGLRQLKS